MQTGQNDWRDAIYTVKYNLFAVGLGTLLKNSLEQFNLLHFYNSGLLIVALHNKSYKHVYMCITFFIIII